MKTKQFNEPQPNTHKEARPITSFDFSLVPNSTRHLALDESLHVDDNFDAPRIDNEHAITSLKDLYPMRINFSGLLLLQAGEMRLSVNFEQHTLRQGDLFVTFPGAIIEDVSIQRDCRLLFIAAPGAKIVARAHLDDLAAYLFFSQRVLFVHLNDDSNRQFLTMYQLLREFLAEPTFINREDAAGNCLAVMKSIVTQNLNIVERPAKALTRKASISAQFIACVSKNFSRHRDLQFYADELRLSSKYLSRVVLDQTGRRPAEWIKDYVILEAKTLLRTGLYSVQQVADMLNFPNQSFFGKYFKDAVGCSPKKY